MSDIESVAKIVGSRRYARDLIECPGTLQTRPWWDGIRNNWSYEDQNTLIRARTAHGYADRTISMSMTLRTIERAAKLCRCGQDKERK